MSQLIYFLIFICGTLVSFSQNYFISFKDKEAFDSLSISQLLSQRSIERRINQNIALNFTDISVNKQYVDSLTKLGAIPIHTSKWFNGILINSSNTTLINQINSLEFVSSVHNLQQTSTAGGIQSFDNTDYGSSWQAVNFFNIQNFHKKGNLGQGKLIGVFDSGFTGLNTSTTFANIKIADRYNFYTNNQDIYNTGSSHGTSVVSILSASETGKYIGFAPNAQIALYATENISFESIVEEYYWLFAAERADSLGVDIINSSLGYYDFDFNSTNHTFEQLDGNTAVISRAANLAAQKGILVVSSSGNSNTTSIWPHINFPSDAELVLTVGSIDDDGNVSSYSSRGPINNTYIKPELVAPGRNTAILNSAGNITTSSGTSFSAPMISGLACLVWNEFPNLSAQEIKQLLIKKSSNFQSPNVEIGYGYPMTNKILNIDSIIDSKKITDIIYFDLIGRLFDGIPTKSGLYLQKTIYSDSSISTQRIYID